MSYIIITSILIFFGAFYSALWVFYPCIFLSYVLSFYLWYLLKRLMKWFFMVSEETWDQSKTFQVTIKITRLIFQQPFKEWGIPASVSFEYSVIIPCKVSFRSSTIFRLSLYSIINCKNKYLQILDWDIGPRYIVSGKF